MDRSEYLKRFHDWRKAAGTLLRDGREKRGDLIDDFLKATKKDHLVLQDPKIWGALENGRVRSRTKNRGEVVILTPSDYARALKEYSHVYNLPDRSDEKTKVRALIQSQPRL